MAWLHTWSGVVVGWVLYFVFFTGTIGYFYIELDRWMRPELPLAAAEIPARDFTRLADRYLRQQATGAKWWMIDVTAPRSGAPSVQWAMTRPGAPDLEQSRIFDQRAGSFREIHPRATGGAYELYRMHWGLHYLPGNSGYLIVGVCALVMLVALITGVITHKKIFVDFFTFRPGAGQRGWLDGHVTASVLALPFLVMMTYTGLAYYRDSYVPAATQLLYGGDKMAFIGESYSLNSARPSGTSSGTIPLEQVLDSDAFQGTSWGVMRVDFPGDADADITVYASGAGSLLRTGEVQLHVSGRDGRLVRRISPADSPGRGLQSSLEGLHEAVFAGLALRWALFLCGVMGTLMVATGLVLWTVKRRAQALRNGDWGIGHQLVDRLNIGTIAGLPLATAAYFWANRLLPIDMPDRAAWEMHCLFITWAVALIYPLLRHPAHAWVDELSAGALAFGLLPLVNALTTERHLGVTLPAGDWALAGVDLTLLGVSLVLAAAAALVRKRLRSSHATPHAVMSGRIAASFEARP